MNRSFVWTLTAVLAIAALAGCAKKQDSTAGTASSDSSTRRGRRMCFPLARVDR